MKKFRELKWWQIALLSVVVSAIGGLASGHASKKNRKVYDKKLKQAPWAPPGWLFAPAWNINNFFLLLALQKLLKKSNPERHTLLTLQVMIWIVFFSFGYVYFNKKSPVMAAAWTVADATFAVTSFIMAFKSDKKLSYNYVPLVVWTCFASTIAAYQALYNADPVLNTQPLLD